jgi:RND family efflux transporter MFP subunit
MTRPGVTMILRVTVTLLAVAVAALLFWWMWRDYMLAPWTRDGRVRAEVANVAPDVSGPIAELKVIDNQIVARGDVLFVIDQARFRLALRQAQATLDSRRADLRLRRLEAERRARLTSTAVSREEQQQYEANAAMAAAAEADAEAQFAVAQLNLERTEVRAPVNGFVTNLRLRVGDYAAAGQPAAAIVDRDSFWVAGYFEETKLPHIAEGDPARVELMGVATPLAGHVGSIARGIADPNGMASVNGLPNVNPTFTWVRLAQRIPVRIELDQVPDSIRLTAGQTCTVIVTLSEK